MAIFGHSVADTRSVCTVNSSWASRYMSRGATPAIEMLSRQQMTPYNSALSLDMTRECTVCYTLSTNLARCAKSRPEACQSLVRNNHGAMQRSQPCSRMAPLVQSCVHVHISVRRSALRTCQTMTLYYLACSVFRWSACTAFRASVTLAVLMP